MWVNSQAMQHMYMYTTLYVQGDAAFWWNLKKSGEGDLLTRHAGCPVLVGSKWGQCSLTILKSVMILLFKVILLYLYMYMCSVNVVACTCTVGIKKLPVSVPFYVLFRFSSRFRRSSPARSVLFVRPREGLPAVSYRDLHC